MEITCGPFEHLSAVCKGSYLHSLPTSSDVGPNESHYVKPLRQYQIPKHSGAFDFPSSARTHRGVDQEGCSKNYSFVIRLLSISFTVICNKTHLIAKE